MPANDTYIELQPILNSMPDISDQLSAQIVQKILKASSVNVSKFEYYHLSILNCTKLIFSLP